MAESAEVGKRGEDLAVSYLRKLGYQILFRNWKTPRWGEIDIVAREGGDLVFAEVKTRSRLGVGEPFESVNFYKLRTLKRAAFYFKERYPKTPNSLRIDVLSVVLNEPPKIEHFRNIYEDTVS